MELRGRHIHFMGAGGIGVSALARMAKRAGAVVSACDRSLGDMTDLLEKDGITVRAGHGPEHVTDVDLLVYSSAVPADNAERMAARAKETRGAFLARFLNCAKALGVCGTHGKTTTAWMLSHILIEAGLEPSVFIGGMVPDLSEGNFRVGRGAFVAELDESDGSFLLPRLATAVVTNVESDHLSHYGDDAALYAAFERFADGVGEDGVLVAGVDSPVARDIFQRHRGRKLSFAVDRPADFRAVDLDMNPACTRFRLLLDGNGAGEFDLPLAGVHNVQNALAAAAAAATVGVSATEACRLLAAVRGVERRMELLGTLGEAALYSDYAHHPAEVAAAISAARQRHGGRVMVVFQPHLYSRTRDYADDFAVSLALADRVLLVDIYPAREEPIPGVSSELVAAALRAAGGDVHGPVNLERVAAEALRLSRDCEAVVMMGAGDIDAAARAASGREGGR